MNIKNKKINIYNNLTKQLDQKELNIENISQIEKNSNVEQEQAPKPEQAPKQEQEQGPKQVQVQGPEQVQGPKPEQTQKPEQTPEQVQGPEQAPEPEQEQEPVIVKRKRGRPKKKRDDSVIIVEKVKKKRGRKPRIKNDIATVLIPKKKRGRKRRDRFYSLSIEQKHELFEKKRHQDSIIVKLPIDIDSLEEKQTENFNNSDNIFIENNILTYKPDLNIPKPFDPVENGHNLNMINEHNDCLQNEKLISIESNIENLMNSYKEVEYNLYERGQSIRTSVKNSMNEFSIANKSNQLVDRTNVRCWWCCYEFDNKPIGIPISYREELFNIYGCFCSFNCALSYNFDTDDNKKWERISLIHLLYKKIYDVKEVNLSYAPQREFLKIFGGHMDIDKFRNPESIPKKYEVIYPPMLSILPQLEETEIFIESNNMRKAKQEIPVDNERIQRAREKLKLKRSKPLRERNTLEHCMNLTRNK